MFPRKKRYPFSEGAPKKVISGSFFTLRFQESDTLHIGVVVSKRIDQKATGRNRVKRIFTHELQEIFAQKNIPYNMVFFLKKDILGNTDLIHSEILAVFKKANISV